MAKETDEHDQEEPWTPLIIKNNVTSLLAHIKKRGGVKWENGQWILIDPPVEEITDDEREDEEE